MKKKDLNRILYIATVIFSVAYILIGNRMAGYDLGSSPNASDEEYLKARVTRIVSVDVTDLAEGMTQTETVFDCEILKGDRKGETVSASQVVSDYTVYKTEPVKEGDRVVLSAGTFELPGGTYKEYFFYQYVRSDAVWGLFGVFVFFVLLFGRGKGVNTIISLTFTCLSVIMVLVPSVLAGKNIYACTAVTCVYIVIMTLLLVNGFSRKTLAAVLGCIGGVAVSALVCLVMQKIIALTGYIDEEDYFLLQLVPDMDLTAVVYSAILLGALGAVMDVAVDISSSLAEISRKLGRIPFGDMFTSGVRIGRDIMGTMSNTLVLAYLGSSLCSVLLVCSYKSSLLAIFNSEGIIAEILQAVVGSLGILSAIPLTAAAGAFIYNRPARGEAEKEWFMR